MTLSADPAQPPRGVNHLTVAWAGLSKQAAPLDPVWRASLLLTKANSRVDKDDLLGGFVYALDTDVLSSSAVPVGGDMVSLIIRFQAPDQDTAQRLAEAARRGAMSGGKAASADPVNVTRGRMTKWERDYAMRDHPEPDPYLPKKP